MKAGVATANSAGGKIGPPVSAAIMMRDNRTAALEVELADLQDREGLPAKLIRVHANFATTILREDFPLGDEVSFGQHPGHPVQAAVVGDRTVFRQGPGIEVAVLDRLGDCGSMRRVGAVGKHSRANKNKIAEQTKRFAKESGHWAATVVLFLTPKCSR
jgi:hypothetical protein